MFLSIFLLRIIKRINILYYVRKLKYIMSFEQEANIELQEHVGDSAPQERYLKILLQITQTKINELMATSINQEGKFVTQIGLLNDKISELENFINEQDLSYKEQLKNKETDLQKSNKTNTKYKKENENFKTVVKELTSEINEHKSEISNLKKAKS